MTLKLDLSGSDLVCNTISTGASTPGTAGTLLNTAYLIDLASTQPAYISATIKGVNMNSATTDNAITFTLPTGTTTYKVEKVAVWGASHTLTTATAALYTATGGSGGSGVGIVSDGAINNTSGTADTALNMQDLTIASATTAFTDTTLYFRVGTAEGAAATANVTLTLRILG
jgi:hypothetical protein